MGRLSDEEVYNGLSALFEAFPTLKVPKNGFSVLRTRWGTDPLFLGSYSYPSAASRLEDISALGAPCTVGSETTGGGAPVLCFAGEATSRLHFGTTAGAYLSGEREAQRLLACFKAEREH